MQGSRTYLGVLLDVFASSFAVVLSEEGRFPFLQFLPEGFQQNVCLCDCYGIGRTVHSVYRHQNDRWKIQRRRAGGQARVAGHSGFRHALPGRNCKVGLELRPNPKTPKLTPYLHRHHPIDKQSVLLAGTFTPPSSHSRFRGMVLIRISNHNCIPAPTEPLSLVIAADVEHC